MSTDAYAAYPPITDEQSELFNAVRDPEYSNFLLMTVLLDGEPTVAICTVSPDEKDGILDIQPVYVAVTDAVFSRLTPPPIDESGTLPETGGPS